MSPMFYYFFGHKTANINFLKLLKMFLNECFFLDLQQLEKRLKPK